MAYKIQIENNFFVLTDTVTSVEIIREVRDQVKFSVASTVYKFKWNYANAPDVSKEIVTEFDFSDIVDSTLTSFASQAVLNGYLSSKIGKICCNPSTIDIDITDSASTTLYLLTVAEGGSATQPISDSAISINTTPVASVLAEASKDLAVELDGVASGSWNAMTEVWEVSCSDTTLEVNGTTEGTVASGSTVDIQLSDSGGVVVPTSVTQVGNDFQVVLADAPAPTPRSTAALMKTGQTTSYRTGDDGDLEVGRATSFFLLDSAPLHNDGSATLNTTTNRFTDTLGGQTYTNFIMLDWSTFNGTTVLGWDIRVNGGGANTNKTWNNAIDEALAHSVGGFASGWRLCNRTEISNLIYSEVLNCTNFAPFNISTTYGLWTSTTYFPSSTSAIELINATHAVASNGKTASASRRFLACRTFTVTGTTLS